jgi:tRNA (guanine-N7-)-methyltransferase
MIDPEEPEAGRPELVLTRGAIEGPFRWAEMFGRRTRIEVEIGCGKGRFLAEYAAAHPDRDFLGVEWGVRWVRQACDRLDKAGLENVRLLRVDAKDLLARLIPEGSVHVLHVYFPDPWPKRRHRKRRLFDPSIPPLMERALVPGGELHVATDQGGYFEQIVERITTHCGLEPLPGTPTAGARLSSFGIKYRDQGRALHERVWARHDAPLPPGSP